MRRNHFLILAAIVIGVFGSVMKLVPDLMVSNSLAAPAGPQTAAVTQWVAARQVVQADRGARFPKRSEKVQSADMVIGP
jgi:hypothetical protein